MLDLVILISFGVISYRLIRAIARESSIRQEFGLSNALSLAVALFPLGPMVVVIGSLIPVPLVALYMMAAFCYIPALLLARKQDRALQVAGTDRVREARLTIERAFGSALCGLIYVAVLSVLTWGIGSIRSVGQGA